MASFRSVVQEARREERCGNLREAIGLYRKALACLENDGQPEDADLHNRIGDLHLRSGEPRTAVEHYERSLELLEGQQLYGSAIALCKKILRNAPTHAVAYRRAGHLQATAGLLAEARESYIEYANRMERGGEPDRALEGLCEFVELSGDEEIRLALADRYLVADRAGDAVEQLRCVWGLRIERSADASEIRRRILDIDPDADPEAAPAPAESASSTGADEPTDDGAPAVGEAGGKFDIRGLASELQNVLQRLEGEEKLRQALPLIDRLLRLEPDQVHLLQRKLWYALALDDEETAAEAYLDLGEALDARLSRFKLRRLSTSSSTGVTTAVEVEARPASAPVG